MDFGERHGTRTNGQHYTAADRPPDDQSGMRVASWTGKSPDTPTRRHPHQDPRENVGVSVVWRGCYEETASVEFKLIGPLLIVRSIITHNSLHTTRHTQNHDHVTISDRVPIASYLCILVAETGNYVSSIVDTGFFLVSATGDTKLLRFQHSAVRFASICQTSCRPRNTPG